MPTQGTTKLAQMLDPQVLADMIQAEVGKAIRFAPLAEVDSTLQGQPGSTLTVPKWDYIGDAEDVAEGEAIPMTQLGKTQTTMTIKKAGKGVEITDEAILSGYGDPVGEAARQIAESINHKVDNDVLKALQGATQTFAAAKGLSVDNVHKAMDIFNDEDDEDMVLLCSPSRASELRMNAAKKFMMGSELGANAIIKGTYGEVLGVQIVRSRKCPENEAYLIKKGALKIMLKRETMVETERKAVQGLNVIVANKHYGTYLYKAEKAVKLNITGKVPDKDDVPAG